MGVLSLDEWVRDHGAVLHRDYVELPLGSSGLPSAPDTAAPSAPATAGKAGHYAGSYTDGTHLDLDVDSAGATVSNIQFDLNGHCDGGGTSWGNLYGVGPFSIHSDGSFTGTTNIAFSAGNGTATANIAGTFTPTGSASGTLTIQLAFTDGLRCTSTGTWTAQDQS